MSKSDFLLTYEEAFDYSAESIGGKASNLIKLYHYGIRVPKGVVIPYYSAAACSNTDENCVIQALSRLLPSDSYAIRSSAVGEDSLHLSWAGCFDTFLEVSLHDVPSKIRLCKDSVRNSRVISYAKLHGIPPISNIAILVQEFIPAEYHGVLFSANPVTNDLSECVIEYQHGSSGKVVAGIGHPTTVIINKATRHTNGFTSFSCGLPYKTINELLDCSQIIETILDTPVDVEWVVHGNRIVITQARAITTLF